MVLSICYRWDIWMCLCGSLFYIHFVSIAVMIFSCFCSVVSYSYLSLMFQLHFFQEKVFEQIFLITRSVECFMINVTFVLCEPICRLRACHSLLDSLHKFPLRVSLVTVNKNPVFLTEIFIFWAVTCTAWKVYIFGDFLVCIFPHSDWIRGDTSYLYVFSPNAGKYGPEKTPNTNNFHAVTWTADIRGVRGVFRTQSSIYNGAICEK